jgi:hypothetical protein
MKPTLRSLTPWLAVAALAAAPPARAALGEPESSVARDREALAAVARATTQRATYSVHELERGGTIIREYVSPQGIVFAVTWGGLATPDLDMLLGSYAAEYEEARKQKAPAKGKRAQRVVADHVVVERWGHMRDLHGRAYVPDLVPEGVTADEIH